ncbi:hypothetical protein E4K68_12205 [Desulfosporosinus sp. Sb-LF]|nr:hypothetical protein E4K68_12205 [Desulfosporosinus sp. Sb-LF]
MILSSIILILAAGPFILRMGSLYQAESVYDVQTVKEELQWLEVHAGILNKLGMVRDTELWLALNLGKQDLESRLVYEDEKHRFWLFLLKLQEGKTTEAQKIIDSLGNTPLSYLEQALMSLSKGDAVESRRLLTKTDVKWETLRRQEQTLRHLTLAQAAMITGDYQSTQLELEMAQSMEPNNPACLSVSFDLAIGEGKWAKAIELSHSIASQSWRPKNVLFETQKAILAIHEGNIKELSDSLVSLKEFPRGEAYINYVNGIQALKKGQLEEGKSSLDRALKGGFDGGIKADAQKALEQIKERQNADNGLRALAAANVE